MRVIDVMQRQVPSVSEEDSLGLALQVMLWNELRELPVLRRADGRLVGVIGERDILRAQQRHADENMMRRTVREFMVAPAEQIGPTADLDEAATRLGQQGIGSLIVVEGDAVVGLLTTSDVILALPQVAVAGEQKPAGREESVAAVMHAQPLTAREEDSLILLAGRMTKAGVRHACVIDSERRLVGIVSDRDLRRTIGEPRSLFMSERLVPERIAKLRVAHAMTAWPRTVTEHEPLGAAVSVLLTQRFGALPVVDAQQHPVGVVSYIDVLRYFARRAEAARAQ